MATVSLRSLADCLGKVSARLVDEADFAAAPAKAALNEAAGQLLELANRFPSAEIAKPVPIQTVEAARP